MRELLEKLCMLEGMSGHEINVGKFIRKEFERYTDEILTDNIGNITAVFRSEKSNAKNVMVFGHMDQLGLIVKNIDSDGFITIDRVGGIPEKILPGLELLVGTSNNCYIPAVMGNRSHHITPIEDKYKVSKLAELYVDAGFKSEQEAKAAGVCIGNPIIYKPRFGEMQSKCYGTAMDNRGACAILIDLASKFSGTDCGVNVFLTATVLEEYNLRGAAVAAGYIKPDCAVALDVAISGDTPDTKGVFDVKLGDGPVLSRYTFHGRGTLNGVIPHPVVVDTVKDICEKEKIPLQLIATSGLLTDASYVQLLGEGVPVVDLGFPCRYTHTAVETCDVKDLIELSKLSEQLVKRITPELNFKKEYKD